MLRTVSVSIEPSFSYKLNDLIKNNIYQSNTQRDGNLTVIRTLIHFHGSSQSSFDYSPQINLHTDFTNAPQTDLDLICVVDGSLIIGECKHSSAGFFADSMKSLKSLVEISKVIHPNEVVLSCYEDSLNKLFKAQQSLIRLFADFEYMPKITIIVLEQPHYYNLDSSMYFYH